MTEATATPTTDQPRWIDYMRIDDLSTRLDEANPKAHDIDELRASLGRFGYTAPIELDERTGKLAAGHGRVTLLLLEHESGTAVLPEGLIADADGMWRAPVVRGWRSADDVEAHAYLVTSNRLVEKGGWIDEQLVLLLEEAKISPYGLTGTGYVDDDLTALAAGLDAISNVREHERRLAERDDVDDLPPEPKSPVTQRGDVWLLGPHRYMCGDSRSADDMATLIDGARVDLLFTSPPYNAGVHYDEYDDTTKPWDEYRELLDGVLDAAMPHVIDGGAVCWNIGVSRKVHPVRQMALLEEHGMSYVRTMLWQKAGISVPLWQHTQTKALARYFTPAHTFEFVYLYAKGDALAPGGPIEVRDDLQYDRFTVHQGGATKDLPRTEGQSWYRHASTVPAHVASFPVALPAMFINALCDVGAFVLDPFGGVASTIVAAHDEGRVGLAMELSPGYVDVGLARWERLTGIVPVHAGTGDPRSFLDV